MSAGLETLALGLLAGAGFAAATSLALALAWPHLRGRLARVHPALRSRVVWLAAVAPSALPALLVALCFVPGLLAAAGLASDHCDRHPDHLHLCLSHARAPLTQAGAGGLALAAILLGAAVAPELMRVWRTRRWLAGLVRRATWPACDVLVFESATPFAFAAGLRRPCVHVAASLVDALPPRQLAAVVEHERAHARRRDPLARLVARLLSRAHLPGLRRTLLHELKVASEQACDAEAGRRVGDRLAVAEAILAVERILSRAAPAPAGVAGIDGSSLGPRVRALLEAEPAPPRRGVGGAALALALLAGLALADPLHHATEHLLALVAPLH
jgi:Zn-dependent protease with chaperone function